MNAPSRLTPLQLDKALSEHIERYYVIHDYEYRCRKCGSRIDYITGRISVHDGLFPDCARPSGRVLDVPLPFCPQCEGPPSEVSGCVHMPTFAATSRRNVFIAMAILAGSLALMLGIEIVR
jgi:hypothetical protein